jgi:hypothetical protein
VTMHILPVLDEQAVLNQAVQLARQLRSSFAESILQDLMGGQPEGVIRELNTFRQSATETPEPETPVKKEPGVVSMEVAYIGRDRGY